MNILLIYPKVRGTTAEYYEKSLRKKHSVEVFDLLQTPGWSLVKKLFRKVKDIRSVVETLNNKPDLVIEIDGLGMYHLKGYKRLRIPTVYYAIDSHRKLDFQKEIAPDFDWVFVAQKDYINSFKEVTSNVFWLPLAADPSVHKRYNVERLFDIGYVGSKVPERYPKRISLLNKLSAQYGVLSVDNMYFEQMAKIYSLCKIGFNKSIGGDLNMRVFEIMSCGTMLLTDKIGNGLNDLFEDKKHLVLYDEDSLDELVQYYLEREDEREEIARQGQREVHEKHTYDSRVNEMLSIIRYQQFNLGIFDAEV